MTDYQRLCKLLCGGPTAYTPAGVSQWRKAGRYGKVPKEGAFIYFYSSGLGRVSHVGIVAAVEFSNGLYRIRTREGNTAAGKNSTAWRDGGKCMEHTYEFLPAQVGGAYRINGFGYPVYDSDTCSAQQLIAEAGKWLGYLEKEHANADLEDKTADPGDNNCTIFGRWYGLTVGDTATYTCAQWCSMYCCYCAYMACVNAHKDVESGWVELNLAGIGKTWTYRKEDGSFAINEWVQHGGRWYVFDGEGHMITGWFKASEGWYYLAGDGAMCKSQWIAEESNGKSYYVSASGLMATNCYVRSDKPYAPGRYIYYWVDADGEWDPQWDTENPDLKTYYCVA